MPAFARVSVTWPCRSAPSIERRRVIATPASDEMRSVTRIGTTPGHCPLAVGRTVVVPSLPTGARRRQPRGGARHERSGSHTGGRRTGAHGADTRARLAAALHRRRVHRRRDLLGLGPLVGLGAIVLGLADDTRAEDARRRSRSPSPQFPSSGSPPSCSSQHSTEPRCNQFDRYPYWSRRMAVAAIGVRGRLDSTTQIESCSYPEQALLHANQGDTEWDTTSHTVSAGRRSL